MSFKLRRRLAAEKLIRADAVQVSLGFGFKVQGSISLYCSDGILFHVEWCIDC